MSKHARRSCGFVDNTTRCTREAAPLEPFCVEHLGALAVFDNPALIMRAAETMRDCLFVTEDKKIGLRSDVRRLAEFGNYFTALLARGYTYEEAMRSISAVHKQHGTMDDILAAGAFRPKWQKFEKVVSAIHTLRCEGASVRFDEKIVGQISGRKRQCDVTLRFSNAYYNFLLVIECRDKKRPVSIDEVEALCQKLRDVGADKGVIVSAHGFQAGAREVAHKERVDLFTLEEIKTDWTAQLREELIRVPFPVSASFDHGGWKQPGKYEESNVGFREIVLVGPDGAEETLAEIFSNVGAWLLDRKAALPVDVDLRFDEHRSMRLPSVREPIPVVGMKIRFEQHLFRSAKRVDLPPTTTHFEYSDVIRGRRDRIAIEELKKADPDLRTG